MANAPVHHAATDLAHGAQIARKSGYKIVIEHSKRRRTRFAAAAAIERAGRAWPLAAGITLGKVCPHSAALKQQRAVGVDRLQPASLPMPDSVLVDAKAGGKFLH